MEDWENELPFVSVRAAAARIGISYPTLRKMISNGEVKVAQIADRKMIPQSELRRLAESAAALDE